MNILNKNGIDWSLVSMRRACGCQTLIREFYPTNNTNKEINDDIQKLGKNFNTHEKKIPKHV